MLQLDEHVLYALSPHYYPKPKKINPASLRPKSKMQIIQDNDTSAISRRKSKLELNQKLFNKINGKFQLNDRVSFIKPNSEAVQKKRISFIDNPNEFNDVNNENFSLNELINANYSILDNDQIPNNKKKSNKNKYTENAKSNFNFSPVKQDFSETEIKEMRGVDLIGYTKEDENDMSFGKRNCEHRFVSPRQAKDLRSKFFLTNLINQTPLKDKAGSFINNRLKNLGSNNFKTIGNNIVNENLKIKGEINYDSQTSSPKRLLANTNHYNITFQHANGTSDQIDLNTNASPTNKNKFISTFKSRQSNFANANNPKPIMLTTLSVKKETFNSKGTKNNLNVNSHKFKSNANTKYNTNTVTNSTNKRNKFLSNNYNVTISDSKNTNKLGFYQSHNSFLKNNSTGGFNKNNNFTNNNTKFNRETDNNLKIMSSSLHKKNNSSSGNFYNFKNSPTANFKSSPSNKKSLETADLSIIKPSPENELRVNLLYKKSNQAQSQFGDYTQKLRKMRSLDNKLVDKRELVFNKIYSFNSEFNKMLKKEQSKNFDTLYDYQNHMVQFIAEKTSMENLRNLSQKLKSVREINECYNPVNKVNWKLFGKIMRECKEEMRSIRERSFGGQSDLMRDSEQFKKELGLEKKKQINLNKKFSKYESSLKRISPYIPEYLVEKFTKSLKIIN